jgi:crossover junction endodeoxyribonuclease RuvC
MTGRAGRVLGIDTALRSTGVGVVQAEGSRLHAVAHAVIANPRSAPLSACLCNLDRSLDAFIGKTEPCAVAIEAAFFQRNARTAMLLGHARGVAIAVAARRGLPVYEYEPRRVKLAVVGFGGASKAQVGHMVASLLGLTGALSDDMADALAIAVCHLHTVTGHAVLNKEAL